MNDTRGVTPTEAADVDAIHQLVAAADRYQSDVDRFIDLHHPDVVLVNLAGRRVLGRDALRQAMAAALATPLAKVFTRLEVQDIRFPLPDVALVSCVKRISDEREARPDAGTGVPSTASLTFVVVRGHDSWRIASAQTTPLLTV